MKRLLVVLTTAATAACANLNLGAPPPSTPAQPPATAQAPQPSRLWNLERETCAELLAASHEDRTVAAVFYYGYVSARANTRIIDSAQVEARVRSAVAACEANPAQPILQAFTGALVPRRATAQR
jgi:hypothetical protein